MSNSLIKCGISLPFTDIADFRALDDLPEAFEFVELRGDVVKSAALLQKEHPVLQEFEFFNFRDLIDSSLTCQLTPENRAIVQEYKKELRELFNYANNCGAETAGIDPDWEQLSADKNKLELFNDILRATAGDRENYQIDLAIAVRLPGSGGIPVKDAAQLLNKLCCHRVKLALDIHPHELLAAPVEWEKLLANFRFNTSCVRFCYPSELGNKLLYQHIEPIVKVLKKFQQNIYVYIAPSGKADFNELADLINFIGQENQINES